MPKLLRIACALGFFPIACGGSSSTGSDDSFSTGESKWVAYCQKEQQHFADCGQTPGTCSSSAACFAHVLTPAALDSATKCLLARTCDQLGSDDACVTPPNATLPADRLEWYQSCVARVADCAQEGVTIKDDDCAFAHPSFRSEVFAAGKDCFANNCADIGPCIEAYLVSIQCK